MGLFKFFKKNVPDTKPMSIEDELSRLLKIDINSLTNGGEWQEQTYIDGSPMNVKAMPFSQMVLGIFDLAVIAKLQDGTIYIDFLSKKYAPNVGLMNFIKVWTSKYGLDTNGHGECTQAEVAALRSGSFSRVWENVAILQTKREGIISLVMAMRITLKN